MCPSAMEPRFRKTQIDLATFLSGLVGASCVLPFDHLARLTGEALPVGANSEAWWTGATGWANYAAARVCQTQGWRVESVLIGEQLVRLAPIDEAPADGARSTA